MMWFKRDYEENFFSWANDQGFSYERFKLQRTGGFSTAFACFPRGTTCNGSIIFVHGTGNDKIYPFLTLFKLLLAENYAILSFDLDGHGKHSTATLTRDSLGDCLDEVVLQSIQRCALPQPFFLLGHSLGAVVALHYAARSPMLGGLVLISMPRVIPLDKSVLLPELLLPLSREFWLMVGEYGLWGSLPALGPFKRSDFPVRITASGTSFDYLYVVRDAVAKLQRETVTAKVTAPTLLVYGAQDQIAPPAAGAVIAEQLPAAELATITGANHFTTIVHPAFQEKLWRWLQG